MSKNIYTKDQKKPRSRKVRRIVQLVVAIGLMVGGGYLLLLTFAPRITVLPKQASTVRNDITVDRVIIPSVDIDEPIVQGGEEALEKGAWHRFPDRGNPAEGGNFIVSAHRFVFDTNPSAVKEKSRFYRIEDINEGDSIIVHWDGQKYDYKVTRKYQVQPDQTEIEDPSNEAKLTLYSCTLGGRYDGRIVIEAKLK